MLKTTKKTTLAVIITIVLVAVVAFASTLYPNAQFVFSGMTMQNGANGKVQGFLNLRLKNVNATGVSFSIKYDDRYIVPSDYSTNEATDDFDAFYVQNTDNFAENTLSTTSSYIDDTSGMFSMLIKPNKAVLSTETDNGHIGFVTDYEDEGKSYFYIGADEVSGGLELGILSFQLVDPAAVSQMSQAELNKIFYVEEDTMAISYYDEENKFCTETIEYEWDVETRLIDVWPVSDTINVLAPDIYNDGSEQDLIDYLNLNHKKVELKWSNGDITLDNMEWDFSKCTITGDSYSPKGGVYTVTQQYNDKFNVSIKVNVEKVNLVNFQVDNDNITYQVGSQPTDMAGLSLPESATPVLDKVVNRFALANIALDFDSWNPNTLPENFVAGVEDTYEFTNAVDISSLETVAPWLTTENADTNVKVYRTIGDKTPAPLETEITATVDKLTGVLTIDVSSLDGNKIDAGTTFRVKFPNGYILDSSKIIMTETVNNDGTATIVIQTSDLTDMIENAVQSMINLGSSQFALSAKAPNKGESDFTLFTSPKRENFYTQDESIDYSGDRRSYFTVYAGMALSDITKYINLANYDLNEIHIAYDGQTGQQPATMRSVNVDGWQIKDDLTATNLPTTVGETITLVGTMTDGYCYTNHGVITNTDGYVLELKVTVSDEVPPEFEEECIKVTTNETETYEQIVNRANPFYYDAKQIGYDTAQSQTFTIHNIGTADIEGLSVQISNTTFVLDSVPDSSIEKETGNTTFKISTKTGLVAGEYRATVTVGSNGNQILEQFEIIFKVTNGPVYKVTVTVSDSALGDAVAVGGVYYEEGETVILKATPKTDCAFDKWESTDAATVNGSTDANETFSMPAWDVEVKAIFDESIEGKLRLADLRVKNPDNSENVLRDVSNAVIEFSPDIYEYYVTVPYETEQNKIWIKPKCAQIAGTSIVPVIEKSGVDISCTLDDDDYYKTDLFNLEVGQNVYTITQSYGGYSRVYTVTIKRKQKVNVTLAYGNSPYGLIDADTVMTDKSSEKAYFSANYCYNDAPEGAVNTANEKYYPDAWIDKNYDEDSTALFVYSGKAFVDSGFTDLVNSAGDAVDVLDVKRTIKVMNFADDAETDVVVKMNNTTEYTDTILAGGESCVINTVKDNKIRPGIYKIVYSFTDSDGIENVFSKPLIVLYDKGDTDATQTIDNADYTNLYNRMKNGISSDIINNSIDWCGVYAYRICDVNSDRNVNSIDANKIKKSASLTKFYEELPDSQ